MRIYDPRLGRFLTIDPVTKKFPELAPFQFGSNRPIEGIDIDGLEFYSIHIRVNADGSMTKIGVTNYTNIKQEGMNNVTTDMGYGAKGKGVEYVFLHYDKDGKYCGFESKMIENTFGVYQGKENPKAFWSEPDSEGNYPDDYTLPPVNETDALAQQHDKDYDAVNASGPSGVLDKKTIDADEKYIAGAEKVIEKHKNGQTDKITGKNVTKETRDAARDGRNLFKLVRGQKTSSDEKAKEAKKLKNEIKNGPKM